MIMNTKRNNEQVKVTIILNTVITVNKHINNCLGMRSVLMYLGGTRACICGWCTSGILVVIIDLSLLLKLRVKADTH